MLTTEVSSSGAVATDSVAGRDNPTAGDTATALDSVTLLSAIRFADSAFPTGGFAFSSGLESSYLDGHVRDEDTLFGVVEEHLMFRWDTFDRVFLGRYFASPTLGTAVGIDEEIERRTSVDRLRAGSRQAGAALLGGFAHLGQGDSARYREGVLAGNYFGHLTIAQAIAFSGAGLNLRLTEIVSAWHLINGLAGAALRLGIVGHLSTQRVIAGVLPTLAALLDTRDSSGALGRHREVLSFSTLTDIAAARRSGSSARLFAT